MRIGLLTLPLETGYGSILQAYALKTVLTRQGHEVILIRRLVKKKRFNGWNILKRSVKKYIFRKPACVFYDKKIYDEYPVITQHTQPFIDKWLQPFSPVYYNSSAYKSIRDLKCDAYIVGSDQVWRKGCMEEIKDYYFSPIDGRTAKLIAYAASFGIDKWAYSKKETRFCTQKLKEFTAVSVREDSGMELCKRHLNHTAEHVLDPTMLLTPADYRALIGEGGAEKYTNKITAFNIRPFRRQTGGAEKSLESFSHGLQLCSDGNRRQTGPSRKKNSAIRSGLAEGDVLCRFYFHGLLSRLRFFHSVQQTVRIIRQQKQRRRTIRVAVEAVQDREQNPIRFKRIGELPHKTIHRLEAHKCETGRNAFKIHVLPRKCAYCKRRTIKSD